MKRRGKLELVITRDRQRLYTSPYTGTLEQVNGTGTGTLIIDRHKLHLRNGTANIFSSYNPHTFDVWGVTGDLKTCIANCERILASAMRYERARILAHTTHVHIDDDFDDTPRIRVIDGKWELLWFKKAGHHFYSELRNDSFDELMRFVQETIRCPQVIFSKFRAGRERETWLSDTDDSSVAMLMLSIKDQLMAKDTSLDF